MSERSSDPAPVDPALSDSGTLPVTTAGRGVIIALLLMTTAAVAGAVATGMYANSLSAQLDAAQVALKGQHSQVQVPTRLQQYRLRPEAAKPMRPSLALDWPPTPQLLDILVDLSESSDSQFQLTLDRSDGVRVMQLQHMSRDANKDLHFSLNSSAFARGDYLLRIDSYDWRGRTKELGWLRLRLG